MNVKHYCTWEEQRGPLCLYFSRSKNKEFWGYNYLGKKRERVKTAIKMSKKTNTFDKRKKVMTTDPFGVSISMI